MRLVAFATLITFLLAAGCGPGSSPTTELRDAAAASSVADVVAKLERFVALYKQTVPEAERARIRHDVFALINGMSIDRIELVLGVLVDKAGAQIPQLGEKSPAQKRSLIKQLADSVAAEAAYHESFVAWTTVQAQLAGILRQGGGGAIGSEGFVQDLERLARTRFVAYEAGPATPECDPRQNPGALADNAALRTCVLRNGEASFAVRDHLVTNAAKSIWIFSWALYDDYTGRLYRDKLIEKKRQNPALDIRVAVDGATASRDTYREVVNDLIAHGIQVIRWRRVDDFRGYGLHRKLMIVDHGTGHGAVICGGMNFGDEYSRINPDSAPKNKWRDTDLLVTGGDAVAQAANVFATGWNAFAANPPAWPSDADQQWSQPLTTIADVPAAPGSAGGRNLLAFVNHEPTLNRAQMDEGGVAKTVTYDPIYLITLRGIEGAMRSVDISNAYYIATPAIEDALLRASRRGVKVRVHTNSKDSVGDPVLIRPILRGLGTLMREGQGIEVYLRLGSTLHSKYLIVDGTFGWIGSYNLHPRSYWYESEAVAAFVGPDLGSKVAAMYQQDIADTMEAKLAMPGDVALPASETATLTDALEMFFFNLL